MVADYLFETCLLHCLGQILSKEKFNNRNYSKHSPTLFHQKSGFHIVSPPSSEHWKGRVSAILGQSLVNKHGTHATGTRVQILCQWTESIRDETRLIEEYLVRAPNCKINIPIVKMKRNIADSMGSVNTDDNSFRMSSLG